MSQDFISTRQEVYNYLKNITQDFMLSNYELYTTKSICKKLNVSRNLVSQYLNEFFKDGLLVKINTRPVYYFDKVVLTKIYQLDSIASEFDDIRFFETFIDDNKKTEDNFKKLIGYNFSLKEIIEKCKVAIEYPPDGLPIYIIGQTGTGKELLAKTMYKYAVTNKYVMKSHFNKIDFMMIFNKNPQIDIVQYITDSFNNINHNDFLYFKNFDFLPYSKRIEVQELLEKLIDKGFKRIIITSSTKMEDNTHFFHKIPLLVELPELDNRSIFEKEQLILYFLQKEEKQLNMNILISEQAYQALIQYIYHSNIDEMSNILKISLANAYRNSVVNNQIIILFPSLPSKVYQTFSIKINSTNVDNKLLTLNDLHSPITIQKDYNLIDNVVKKGICYINNKISLDKYINCINQMTDEYSDYILFKTNIDKKKEDIIEKIISSILSHIEDVYSISFSNSLMIKISRWVYFSDSFNSSLMYYNESNSKDLEQVYAVIKKEMFNEYTIALELIRLIKQNTDVQLSCFEHIILAAIVYNIGESNYSLPIKASILAHGHSTASSIADVCNKMLHHHIFNAIDMPYDVPISEIVKQLKKILSYNENRDVLLLVDLGSLENIVELLGDIPNVNVGIINNVSTNQALEIGASILNNQSIEEILSNAKEKVVTSYKIIEKFQVHDVMIFVSEIGSETAVKVSTLFMESLNKNINVDIRCYDYNSFMQFYQSSDYKNYNIIFVATTIKLDIENVPILSIEEIITFKNLDKIKKYLTPYISNEEFHVFSKNILNVFSLQNVIETLTILNANKVLSLVAEMLDELQSLLRQEFKPKTIVGLNIHICCLIERLVKKELIETHINFNEFENKEKEFIDFARKIFQKISKQYNIELPISEIAYIYDYVSHDSVNLLNNEEDF